MLTVRSIIPSLDRALTLNREIDRMFADSWNAAARGGWLPAADIIERNDAYIVALELPGVKPEGVEVSFEQNTLTVRGTKPATLPAVENEEMRVYAAERLSGDFERSVRLPSHVDAEAITAAFEHGVLKVTVPKKAAAMPRKITITAAPAAPAAGN
ncbi:MAG TPA: Hsp20/alpha crystallin family protein [Gemmatimonadaceae bacterium]|nr:Hsp20/alpha crystallin family protein [Gemmatimonadaceae bacterium]